MENVAAIILAAGKGKRMNSNGESKTLVILGKKPLIVHTIDNLEEIKIYPIIVVVGYAKESIMNTLGNKVIYAVQDELTGTATALKCGLAKLPKNKKTVLVMDGDDSAFYSKELFTRMIDIHEKKNAALTLMTIEVEDPAGLGRIVRNSKGGMLGIVEDKDATSEQKTIKEINPGLYVFGMPFLNKYLDKIEKSPISGEYYLTSLVDIAIKNKEKLIDVRAGKIPWRGVNTPEELMEAEKIFAKI
jgi:bifunctional UDP-N-acetylglucosamine pyrophosphorylase / glucosamine-1-phosphate N-acetyltransferase